MSSVVRPHHSIPLSVFLYLLLQAAPHIHAQPTSALACTAHPAFSNRITPVLVRSWQYQIKAPIEDQPTYLPRYRKHAYAPLGTSTPSKYARLDLFYPVQRKHPSYRIHFHRPARVHLLVHPHKSKPSAKTRFHLPGWKPSGWATLVKGPTVIKYGLHTRVSRPMPRNAYVFTLNVRASVLIPAFTDLVKAVKSPLTYTIWISEKNGSPSPEVGLLNGKRVIPNTRCPDALHNRWMIKDHHNNDPDTKGRTFRTWHPAWDPCWWCAYDHEHGSNPGMFGYKPLYDYTAYKNGRQDEPQAGFKGYVFETGGYWGYINVHVQTSSLRRIKTQFHTINMVFAKRGSGKIVADLRFKADFGFAAVQLKDRTFLPMDAASRKIRKKQTSVNFRTFNILNKKKPNRRFLLKDPIEQGVYEEWQTLPMCTKGSISNRTLQLTMKRPGTGILGMNKLNARVNLGRIERGQFYRSINLFRTVKFHKLTVSDRFCPGESNGVFYTDAAGKKIVKGPARDAVRQYIQPGFTLKLNGKYEPVDPWSGLYKKDIKGIFHNPGYGLDPDAS